MSFPVRAIDHFVLASRDLATQAAYFQRIGFQVGARNRHPWGTENHIIQFEGSFLELISSGTGFVRQPDLNPHDMSFPVFIAGYLAIREGFAMLALRSDDADADRESFAKAGIGDFETFNFARRGRRPDGSDTEVAFTLAFARSPLIPQAGFFTCQHRFPENFWSAAQQAHPNGATGVAGAVMIAENPAAHAEFLSHLTGQREMLSTSMGLEIDLGAGQKLEVLTPLAFRFRFGDFAADTNDATARMVAVRILVRDLDALRAVLREAGVAAVEHNDFVIVPANAAFGAVLAFQAV